MRRVVNKWKVALGALTLATLYIACSAMFVWATIHMTAHSLHP